MKNDNVSVSCEQAKKIDLVDYLSALGHQAKKVSGFNYWYLSPLREEKTPSFKVDRRQNLWYDHGLGKGGTIIDLGLLYFRCSVSEFLQKLGGHFCFHQPYLNDHEKGFKPAAAGTQNNQLDPSQSSIPKDKNSSERSSASRLKIHSLLPITSLQLQRYLHTRNIPFTLGRQWLREVEFFIGERPYKTLGFLNASGGYELRSASFKGSSAPKDVTTVERGRESLAVFEGFFDFLSFLTFYKQGELLSGSFLILNSLSFIEKSLPYLASFNNVSLFLDRDAPGRKQTESLLTLSSTYRDESSLYSGYKDINEWVCSIGKRRQQQQRPGIQ